MIHVRSKFDEKKLASKKKSTIRSPIFIHLQAIKICGLCTVKIGVGSSENMGLPNVGDPPQSCEYIYIYINKL
jgi:hypothetical protein